LGRESELTIIDGRGRVVTINKPVERIATAYSSAESEMLRTLKVTEKVVGVDEYTSKDTVFFPELSKLPTYGWGPYLDYEALLALNPDFVITATYDMDWVDQLLQVCQDAGITVVCFSYLDGEEFVLDYTIKLGYTLDSEEEAKKFIDFVQHSTDEIEEKVKDIPEDDKPKVYVESLYGEWRAASRMSPPGSHCPIAGGRNIAADLPIPGEGGGPSVCSIEVDAEWVIKQNPDVIIRMGGLGSFGFGGASGYDADDPSDMKALRDEIMNRPELANVKAVKTGQVYVMSCTALISPTYCIGVPYMAKAFYPDLFSDVNANGIHQEYLTEFQGLDYDLDEHGVFIYHPVYFPEGR
ncbi:MAG: ABC transporter substrate-binding protein, partial [Methanophagales archaeon]|nr:ABC transporter substrate-binding protein [Methanophagales archaeon]